MKSLKEYIVETSTWIDNPSPGDDFELNLNEDCLITTYITESTNDGFVIHADEKILSLLEEYGCKMETIRRYGAVGSSMGMGHTIAESHMSEVDAIIQDIINGEVDAYDIMAHPKSPEEEYVARLIQDEYEKVSIDHRLHPDDDFEKILDIVVDHFANDYGHQSANEDQSAGVVAAKELATDITNPMPDIHEAEYQGHTVTLNKPTRGDVKKFKVYVKDPSTGNIKKVNFGHGGTSAKRAGQKTMRIKKSNPDRRRSFRARHHCENPGPKTKARYWSCRAW